MEFFESGLSPANVSFTKPSNGGLENDVYESYPRRVFAQDCKGLIHNVFQKYVF